VASDPATFATLFEQHEQAQDRPCDPGKPFQLFHNASFLLAPNINQDVGVDAGRVPVPGANLRDIPGASVISQVARLASAPGPTIDELVRVAADAGLSKATRRTIRGMVEHGFVGSPRRVRSSWRYRNVALGQVAVVSRYRLRRVGPELTRVAVFVETGTGDVEHIRAFACPLLREWQKELDVDLERLRADPVALPAEAARAARVRRDPPLPHRVRMRLEDRELAVLFALTRMAETPLPEHEAEKGEFQLLRALGLKSGRGGPISGLSDLMPPGGQWPPQPGALSDALASVGSERIVLAGRVVEWALIWIPALRSIWLTEFGPSGVALVDILATWSQNIPPALYVMMLGAFVMAGLRSSDDDIREGLREFAPEVAALDLLADRAAADWKLAAERLGPYQRMRFTTAAHAVGMSSSLLS
jgi:hypothetical protein